MIPPRRCQRPATKGEYCGLHVRQSTLQDLLRECLSPGWERTVQRWHEQQRQEQERQGRKVVTALARCAEELKMYRLTAWLKVNDHAIGKVWADAG